MDLLPAAGRGSGAASLPGEPAFEIQIFAAAALRGSGVRALAVDPNATGSRSDERWMKIATFNINNIRRRLPNLLDWLNASKPDVVCLQELKCSEGDFPAASIKEAGYSSVWRGEKTWNGVAILARNREPLLTSTALPGDFADQQARYIEAAVAGILVCCLYLPNGNPQPGPKFDYKLAWFRRLEKHAGALIEAKILRLRPALAERPHPVPAQPARLQAPARRRLPAQRHPAAGRFVQLGAGLCPL